MFRLILVITILSSYHFDSRNGTIVLVGPTLVVTALFLPILIMFSAKCHVTAKMIGWIMTYGKMNINWKTSEND